MHARINYVDRLNLEQADSTSLWMPPSQPLGTCHAYSQIQWECLVI